MKRTDIQIYILGHKPIDYGVNDNALYTFLQVGAFHNKHFTELTDDTGKNIGEWNKVFAEATGMYWAAHNAPESVKYIGCTQYRRRIEFPEDTDFDSLFEKCQIIVSEPLNTGMSVRGQYEHCHSKNEIAVLENVVKELYPEYSESWDRYINNGNLLLYSTAFVMKKQDLLRYVDFFTSVCMETLHRLELNTPKEVSEYAEKEIKEGRKPNVNGIGADKGILDYQQQICGFMQERLATLWIFHNFDRILFAKFHKYGGI